MARSQSQTSRAFPNGSVSKSQPPPQDDERTRERIARRAYEIYLGRDGRGGDDLQDWLQAENELRLGRQ